VLRQLDGTGLPEPDHIRILVHLGDVKEDCARMARDLDASVLICNPDGEILAFSRPQLSKLQPDLDVAVNFAQSFRPDGPWTLVAEREYDDDRKHQVTQTCTDEAMLRRFVAFWNADHNIGFKPGVP
jgi:hypothetical protein